MGGDGGGVLLVSYAITAIYIITGGTATMSNPGMDMGMRVGMGREGVINGSGSGSLYLSFPATATTGTQTNTNVNINATNK
jgi:hypothetical protein